MPARQWIELLRAYEQATGKQILPPLDSDFTAARFNEIVSDEFSLLPAKLNQRMIEAMDAGRSTYTALDGSEKKFSRNCAKGRNNGKTFVIQCHKPTLVADPVDPEPLISVLTTFFSDKFKANEPTANKKRMTALVAHRYNGIAKKIVTLLWSELPHTADDFTALEEQREEAAVAAGFLGSPRPTMPNRARSSHDFFAHDSTPEQLPRSDSASALVALSSALKEIAQQQQLALPHGQQTQLALAPHVPRGRGRRSSNAVPMPFAPPQTAVDHAVAFVSQLQGGSSVVVNLNHNNFGAGSSFVGTVSRVEGGEPTSVAVPRPDFCRSLCLRSLFSRLDSLKFPFEPFPCALSLPIFIRRA